MSTGLAGSRKRHEVQGRHVFRGCDQGTLAGTFAGALCLVSAWKGNGWSVKSCIG